MVILVVKDSETDVIYVIFVARNNRKLICIALNDVSSGNYNSHKDYEDDVFQRKYIAFHLKMYWILEVCKISSKQLYVHFN